EPRPTFQPEHSSNLKPIGSARFGPELHGRSHFDIAGRLFAMLEAEFRNEGGLPPQGSLLLVEQFRFTVPLCRLHPRELHRSRNESLWWKKLGIEPLKIAAQLWERTRSSQLPGSGTSPGLAASALAPGAGVTGPEMPRKAKVRSAPRLTAQAGRTQTTMIEASAVKLLLFSRGRPGFRRAF